MDDQHSAVISQGYEYALEYTTIWFRGRMGKWLVHLFVFMQAMETHRQFQKQVL